MNEEVATENMDNIEIIDGELKTPCTWKEVSVVSKTFLSCSVPKIIVPVIRNKFGRSVVKLPQINYRMLSHVIILRILLIIMSTKK